LDPVKWFDLLLKSQGGDKTLQCATEYMAYCEREHLYSGFSMRQKAGTGGCKRNEKCEFEDCYHLHHLWQCDHLVNYTSTKESSRPCGFPTYIEDLLADGPYWALHRRYTEGTRELLIMPKPILISEHKFPHNNIEMVQQPLFWSVALEEIHNLAGLVRGMNVVDRVVINFGKWESAERQDPNLSECHAHAHFWLTKGFISEPIFGDLLADCTATPEDYLLENARDLESFRLNSLRNTILNKSIESIRDDIKRLLVIFGAGFSLIILVLMAVLFAK
jgi:hypothetical protein